MKHLKINDCVYTIINNNVIYGMIKGIETNRIQIALLYYSHSAKSIVPVGKQLFLTPTDHIIVIEPSFILNQLKNNYIEYNKNLP